MNAIWCRLLTKLKTLLVNKRSSILHYFPSHVYRYVGFRVVSVPSPTVFVLYRPAIRRTKHRRPKSSWAFALASSPTWLLGFFTHLFCNLTQLWALTYVNLFFILNAKR